MKTLSISDVKHRLKSIPSGQVSLMKEASLRDQAEKAIQSGMPQRIIFAIESGIVDTSRSMAESTMYELLEALVETGTESQANKYAARIMNEYVSRTRDAKETQKYLKQKLGRAKSKMFTKPKNNLDDMKNAINSMIGAAQKNYKTNMSQMASAVAAVTPHRKRKKLKEESLIEYYAMMEAYATDLVGVDRILENYNRVSKRFNLDRIIQENTPINGVADTAVEICRLIETYDMPVKARYNTCLETVWYGLHKNAFQFDIQEAVTAVTDFYTSKGGNSFACKSILEASVVFDKDDYRGDIDVITEEEPEEDDDLLTEAYTESPIDMNMTLTKADAINATKKLSVALKPYMSQIDAIYRKLEADSGKRIHAVPMSKSFAVAPTYLSKFKYDVSNYQYAARGVGAALTSKPGNVVDAAFEEPHIIITFATTDKITAKDFGVKLKAGKANEEARLILAKAAQRKEIPFMLPPKFVDNGNEAAIISKVPINGIISVLGESTFDVDYMVEGKLNAEQRKNIKDSDYGIPSKRKYPMPDESHVRSAIQMFNHVSSEDEAELAKNIKKKIRQYNMNVQVGKENRFSKYYKAADDSKRIDAAVKEYATDYSGYPVLTEAEKQATYSSKPKFNEIMAKFRASNDEHKESKLQALVRTLYSNSTQGIVEETPNFFSYIRAFFVLGAMAIHPAIAAVTLLCDQIVRISMERDETEKMMQAIKNEIKTVDKKISTCKNEDDKKNLQEYRNALAKGYQKVSDYHVSLLNDAEQDEFYDKQDDSDISIGGGDDEFGDLLGGFDDDFGDDDFGDDFDDEDFEDFKETAGALYIMSQLTTLTEGIMEKTFDQGMCHKMIGMCPSIVGDLEKVSDRFPTIIDRKDLRRAIDDVKSDIKVGNVKVSLTDKSQLNETYRRLSFPEPAAHKTADIFTETRNQADYIRILQGLNDIYSSCVYKSPLTEASFTNSIAIASQKVKKALQSLSDKEKTISKNIDVAASNFSKAAERAMTNDRREGVIKGSIIPSASKVLKGAIATAGLCIIDPVIAVIGVLGYIGVSKKLNDKERALVLDEIEVELKMCDKYIELAEGKNDMKSLKKLYTIQKDLQKQRARIILKTNIKGQRTDAQKMKPLTKYNGTDN